MAPHLIGWAAGVDQEHCIWKKQPETPEELEEAFAAFDASEVGCYRYAGDDPKIMARIGLEYCDGATSDEASQSLRDEVDFDNRPVPIQFTLTAGRRTSVFSKLANFLGPLLKRR